MAKNKAGVGNPIPAWRVSIIKGLDDCFAYRISYDNPTGEKHSCIAIEHRNNKPECCGSKAPIPCEFYKSHAQHNESVYKSALRCQAKGFDLDKKQVEQLLQRRGRKQ